MNTIGLMRPFSVIVPTFNELRNMHILIPRLKNFPAKIKYEIIVVDDNSPDGTGRYVMNCSKRDKKIKLVSRLGKRGLSSAVVDGVKKAQYDFIVVINADFQHDERMIPTLISELEHNDLVVATRRVVKPRKRLRERFAFFRSDVARFLAKSFLGVRLKDPMSAYFAFRKKMFDKIYNRLKPRGFEFLIEFYIKANPKKISEIEYVFRDRKHGASKLKFPIIIAFLIQLLELKIYELTQKSSLKK